MPEEIAIVEGKRWKTEKDSEKSWTVDRGRIEENDFILSASTYKPVDAENEESHREPKEILEEINKLA